MMSDSGDETDYDPTKQCGRVLKMPLKANGHSHGTEPLQEAEEAPKQETPQAQAAEQPSAEALEAFRQAVMWARDVRLAYLALIQVGFTEAQTLRLCRR